MVSTMDYFTGFLYFDIGCFEFYQLLILVYNLFAHRQNV